MSPTPGKIDVAWTREQEDYARAHWAAGDSARQIGIALGRTRNSVCAKLDRMKLHRTRPTPAKAIAGTPPKRTTNYGVYKLQPASLPGNKQSLHGAAWMALPGVTPVGLLDLEPGMCKWPIGDGKPFLFCGRPTDGGPYCDHHHGVAYSAAEPKRKAA